MAELGHVTVGWREVRTSALLEGLTDLHSTKPWIQPKLCLGSGRALYSVICAQNLGAPPSLLCPTFLIGLVDSPDLLVVPRGHDFDEHTLICASPLEERGMVGAAGANTRWGHDGTALQCQARRGPNQSCGKKSMSMAPRAGRNQHGSVEVHS